MAGKILKIDRLSYPQIDSLDRLKTVFLIPVSPLEEHGPHLPVGVDALNANYFAQRSAEIITDRHPEFDAVIFPLIPLGTQVYKHIGSFYVKPSTLYDIIFNTGKGAALYGFKYIFVFSAHGTPKQIVTIEAACKKISKKYNINMYNMTGAIAERFLRGDMTGDIINVLGRTLTDKERQLLKYDFHAGWWETSMMLKLHPELVDSSYKNLKPFLKDFLLKKLLTPDVKPQGYFGSPSHADKEFAEASMEVFTKIFITHIDRCLNGEDITDEVTSSFYKY